MTYTVDAINMMDADKSLAAEIEIRKDAYDKAVINKAIDAIARKMRECGYAEDSVRYCVRKPNIYYNPWYEISLHGDNGITFWLTITSCKGILAQ